MRQSTAWIIIGVAWATLTLLDLWLPAGLVIAAAFISVVVFAFARLAPKEAVIVTAMCSLSVIGDSYVVRDHEAFGEELVERTLIIGAIWLSAFLMYRRRATELALDEIRAQQQAIFDCAADGIVTVDESGVIRSINPAGLRILGYSEGQVVGEPLNTIIPHQYRHSLSEAMSAYAEGRIDIAHLIGVTREVEALKRDGTVIPIEVNVTVAKTARARLFSAVMRDISARREIERQLREQQRALSTLLSNLSGMAYRCQLDSSWTMLFVSQGALELTGYEPFELEHNRAISFEKLIYPADRDRVTELVTTAVASLQSYDVTYRIMHRSGEIRWVMEKGAAVRGHDGALICLEGFITDITRVKRVEEALRESEARFRTIADSTPIMIWASGIDRQITFANKRILEFTGLAIDELLGDSWLSQVHPDDVKRVADYYTLMFDSWQSFEMEYRLRRGDGNYRWVLIAGVPRYAPDGDFMGYIGSGIDIHERKQAELALRESEGRFREMADSSPTMMWLTDSKGMATFVNKTWLDFTGRRFDQELGNGSLESIHPEDQDRVGSAFIEALSRREIWNYEYRIRRHDGVYRWIIDRGAPYYTPEGILAGYCGSCFDYTERREATEALRESEERFRAVANQTPAIIWVAAPDGTCTFMNKTWFDLTGQTLESALGHGWANMIHPDDREAARASTVRGFESRSRYENEFRVRAKDGSWRRLLNSGVPRFGEDGELLGYTGSAIDVTDRDRLDQIISHVATGTSASTDADFFRSLSAHLADALGADMVSIGELHPDDASRMRTVAFLQDREIRSDLEYTLQGTPCAVALSEGCFACREQVQSLFPTDQFLVDNCLEGYIGHALRDSNGVNQGVIWVLFRRAVPDLQLGLSLMQIFAVRASAELERRRAMEALRKSESRYRLLFDESPMATLEVDLSHVKALLDTAIGSRDVPLTDAISRMPDLLERCMAQIRFTTANATSLRLFHAATADELRNNIPALFTESTFAAFGEFLVKLWKGETTYETETKFRTLKGEIRSGQVHCVVTTETIGDWSQVLVAILDVTENRQAAEELGRAKRLETAGRLAGQIAHDFNNLLGPLVAYPEILQAKFPAEGRAHEMLNDMQSAALQIAEINQELLTLSRRGHYNTEPLDLNALVQSAVRTLEIPSTVVVDLKPSPGELKVRGGGAQLMRVLVNLIRNAIEAMDDVGRLTIVTEKIYLDEPLHNYATISRGEYARVAITDTGCGIPSEVLEHIFEPFFTTKKADKKRGTGLGLPVVHSVVEDHEGYIDVTSTPGVGSTFMLYFPLYRGEIASCTTTDAIREGHGELVVVVDDDPLQRRIAQTALERIGYEVVALESGEDAVRYLKHNPADIVLLDMVMGGIDGAETLRQIREIHPGQTALILTGYSTSERVQAALSKGECGVLAKPVQVSTLTSAIHQALAQAQRDGKSRRVSTE